MTTVGHLYSALKALHVEVFGEASREEDRAPLTVPCTSIYSRFDGVVPWQACIDVERPFAENVEVTTSHRGMGVHPTVLRIILDRLGQEEGSWAPYAPELGEGGNLGGAGALWLIGTSGGRPRC